jgi:hypothetical protein
VDISLDRSVNRGTLADTRRIDKKKPLIQTLDSALRLNR